MTTFDESKHNRASDGKFASKPHAEAAGVSLTPHSAPPHPRIAAALAAGDTQTLLHLAQHSDPKVRQAVYDTIPIPGKQDGDPRYAEFIALSQNPTDADHADARKAALFDYYWHSPRESKQDLSWDKLMGHKARHTQKNSATYWDRVEEQVSADPAYQQTLDRHLRRLTQQAAYGRAHTQGIPNHPLTDHEFEKIWAGQAESWSEERIASDLAEAREGLADVESGRVSPRWVVGRGGAKWEARNWYEQKIAASEEGLRSRGRSNYVNVANVEHRLRRMRDGATD